MREVVLALEIRFVNLPAPKLDLFDNETANLNASDNHNSAQSMGAFQVEHSLEDRLGASDNYTSICPAPRVGQGGQLRLNSVA